MKVSKQDKFFQAIIYIIMGCLALICFYPFWHVAMASFSDGTLFVGHSGALLKPLGFSLEAYKEVLKDGYVFSGLKNTLILLGVGLPLDIVMTALAAYFFSRKSLMFKKPLFIFFMITMYVSGGTIPFYLTLKDLHLLNSLWGIILPFCFTTYNMIILRTAFEAIPDSLTEAAQIDGAGHIRILFTIILPLCKATIAVVTLYYGVSIWNGWFWSSAILRSKSDFPLQLILREFLITKSGNNTADVEIVETAKYAAIMISVFPILIVYPFIQKHFTKGVMIGAVKG